jgi:hypothetical protein
MIPLTVEIPNWFDYSIFIIYWIYLDVDEAGSLQGYVDYGGWWVEGGILTGRIVTALREFIPMTIGEINNQISNYTRQASVFGPYTRRYYLPGAGSDSGNTFDDVSLVLVRR